MFFLSLFLIETQSTQWEDPRLQTVAKQKAEVRTTVFLKKKNIVIYWASFKDIIVRFLSWLASRIVTSGNVSRDIPFKDRDCSCVKVSIKILHSFSLSPTQNARFNVFTNVELHSLWMRCDFLIIGYETPTNRSV